MNYKVYIKLKNNYVSAINSSAFLRDLTDWIEIDSGKTYKYRYAQNNYLDKPLFNRKGAYQYKYIDN